MAKHARNTSILVDQYDLSTYLKSVSINGNAAMLDATHFQAAAKVYVPDVVEAKLSAEGFFAVDAVNARASEDVLRAALGTETQHILTVSPEGATLGKPSLLLLADETKYDTSFPATNLLMATAEFQASLGLAAGVIVQALGALTATGNGTSVDNSASSANGGVAHLHVVNVSGTSPTLDGKIQHSSDGSTWADLVTFDQVTDVTSQRITVTGTINRYLRFIRTVGGTSPSFTLAAAFARR